MSTAHVEFADDLRAGIKTLLGTVTFNGVDYPVYRNVPKAPASTYVKIGQVLHSEDGTKDDFVYYGTVYISVIDESQLRPSKNLASGILGVVRGKLKPTRTTVPTVTGRNVIAFNPGGYDEIIDSNEHGTRVQLTDIYEFTIE